MRRTVMAGLLGALALAALAAAPPAQAAEALDPVRAEQLDGVAADYARHTREHRIWEIQRNVDRQRRGGYGYGRGYGRGYGPPPGYYDRGYGYRDDRRWRRDRYYY